VDKLKLIDDMTKYSGEYQGKCAQGRLDTRNTFKNKENETDLALRILIDGLIAKIVSDNSMKKIKSNEKISYQIALSTSFVRTHYIIGDLYLAGDYIEAFTLIRKQYETFTRLLEIDINPLLRLLKKTPNVCNVLNKIGKPLYPKLSAIAHFGTPSVGELLSMFEEGDLAGPNLIPTYQESSLLSNDMNTIISINFIGWLIEKFKVFFEDFDGKEETEILNIIISLAIKNDIIKVDKPDKSDENGKC